MSKALSGPPCQSPSWRPGLLWSCLLVFAAAVHGQTAPIWPDLKDLSPESLTRCFADFAFEQSDQVQDARTFLARKRGDCADFSKLVSETLNQHGYTSKLVVVMMERQTHVVCYVNECRGYLDYNLRAAAHPLVSSDGSLEDIAEKVAASFRSKWRMVSEIRYQGVTPVFIFSAFPPARPKAEPPVQLAGKGAPASPELLPGAASLNAAAQKATGSSPGVAH